MIYPSKITKSSRHSISITINKNGEVVLRAPKYMSEEKILDFYNKKINWVTKKVEECKKNNDRFSEILNYSKILFIGKIYPVAVIKSTINKSFINNNTFVVNTKSKSPNIKNIIKNFYIEVINDIMLPRIHVFAQKLDVDFDSIKYINSKRKWGMCENRNTLYFNYKLLLLPIELIDYVIVHELCHILEMNHSLKFWSNVKKIMPRYKEYRESIKSYGTILSLF